MTEHTLTRIPSKTFPDDPGYFETVETLRRGNHCYGVGGWDMVTGPVAFAFGLAVVITAHREVDTKTYVDVEHGDVVVIDGERYVVHPAPNQNLDLRREA